MIRAIFLDSTPLGLLTQRRGVAAADDCRSWMARVSGSGIRMIVPEIIDYEIRRELLRSMKTASIARLDQFNSNPHVEYLPVTTMAFHKAAELWAKVRQQGRPTADPHALDIDAILAAQALTAGWAVGDFVVATGNVAHLSLFVAAERWNMLNPTPP